MVDVAAGSRLERFFSQAPDYWTKDQLAAFRIACRLAGVVPAVREARLWKHQGGKAFAAWRELSHSCRRELLERERSATVKGKS